MLFTALPPGGRNNKFGHLTVSQAITSMSLLAPIQAIAPGSNQLLYFHITAAQRGDERKNNSKVMHSDKGSTACISAPAWG